MIMKNKSVLTTRNFEELVSPTNNIYESTVIISKRAKQIALKVKQELNEKLAEFVSQTDSLEEVLENKEHIEISRFYDKLPKPTLAATQEFLENKIDSHYPDEIAI